MGHSKPRIWLGEQTEPILHSLGYQDEQISRLRAERVI